MTTEHPTKRIPVIIDTDPGCDDVIALLLALTSPELEILAIITSYGNADAQSSYNNVFKLYNAIARHLDALPEERKRFPNFAPSRKTILARGVDKPLQGVTHTAQYFHGRDGLNEITERHPEWDVDMEKYTTHHPQLQLTDKPGTQVALDLIRSEPARSITYIVLGPMTNLAHVVREDGKLVREKIGRVVCMGGNLDVPGNTNPVAEFNFYADPFAVHELLSPSPSPPEAPTTSLPLSRVLICPLDITTLHVLPFPTYAKAVDSTFKDTSSPSSPDGKPPLVHFTSSFLESTRELMLKFGMDGMELHDIVAVWCAACNPPPPPSADDEPSGHPTGTIPGLTKGWEGVRRQFQIERVGELTRGMLVVDRRNDVGAYAPGANRAQVQAELERHHIHPPGPLESIAVPAQTEVETSPPPPKPGRGAEEEESVPVITKTPGSDVLLKLLLKRVWGVEA